MSKFINKGTEDSGVSSSAPPVNTNFAAGSAREGSGSAGPAVSGDDAPPPPVPAPTPTPAPKRTAPISGGVLNGKAISKPQPAYPPIAKAARASGTVTVQIVVDESGRVISASAVSGHPLLQQAAVSAARNARFSPTLLSGQPVRVTGVLTYNFVLP
jgi:protein TonB